MDFDHSILYLLAAVVLISICALMLLHRSKASRRTPRNGGANLGTVGIVRPVDHHAVLREIDRLKAGGDLDESLLRNISAEDRALFDVALIAALTELPREDQHRLRATLVKHGYDEQCYRRLISGEISDRVRASALLNLLRPQSQMRAKEWEQTSPRQHPSEGVRSAARTPTSPDVEP